MPFDRRSIAIDRAEREGEIQSHNVPRPYIFIVQQRSILGWPLYSNQHGRRVGRRRGGSEKVAARKYERLACHPSSSVTFGYQTFVWTRWPRTVAFQSSARSRVAANVPFRWLETSFLSLIEFPGFLSSEINRFFCGGVASRGHRSRPSIHAAFCSVDDRRSRRPKIR